MKRLVGFLFSMLSLLFSANAQYISGTETIPFVCPSVCQGGKLVLKVFQIENFPSGTPIQAVLSNSSGSFATGTTILPSTRYSFNNGSTWINGAFAFSTNITNLWFEVTIPNTQPLGSNYTVKMRAATGYLSNDIFNCPGGGKITVTTGYTPLPAIASGTSGSQQWIAHAYTWTPTTSQLLLTPALVTQQDFFNQNNYEGHFLKNTLSFDLNFTQQGGYMPGPLNLIHDGTSFGCGEGYATNFALRMMRTEVFAPGRYAFSIAGDDGIRLSLDGGSTWILDSFIEQAYNQSFKSTSQSYPTGICLSGSVNLVIEYFQRPVDMRMSFTATLISPIEAAPEDISQCAGDSAWFLVNAYPGANYQWQISTDGGNTFASVSNTPPFYQSNSNSLLIYPSGNDLDGALVQCVLTNVCPDPILSSAALLNVQKDALIGTAPEDVVLCGDINLVLDFGVFHADSLHWFYSRNTGSFVPVDAGVFFTTDSSGIWRFSSTEAITEPWQVYIEADGCGAGVQFSDTVTIFPPQKIGDALMPNVFTPDGNGMNEVFKPFVELSDFGYLKIYNRWGAEVYSFTSTEDGWDGQFNGTAAPAGIYFYVLEGNEPCSNEKRVLAGSFHLIR